MTMEIKREADVKKLNYFKGKGVIPPPPANAPKLPPLPPFPADLPKAEEESKSEVEEEKKASEEKWNGFWQFVLVISRCVHLSTAMITSSLIILNFVFDNF